jgi:hypothetical protein
MMQFLFGSTWKRAGLKNPSCQSSKIPCHNVCTALCTFGKQPLLFSWCFYNCTQKHNRLRYALPYQNFDFLFYLGYTMMFFSFFAKSFTVQHGLANVAHFCIILVAHITHFDFSFLKLKSSNFAFAKKPTLAV